MGSFPETCKDPNSSCPRLPKGTFLEPWFNYGLLTCYNITKSEAAVNASATMPLLYQGP